MYSLRGRASLNVRVASANQIYGADLIQGDMMAVDSAKLEDYTIFNLTIRHMENNVPILINYKSKFAEVADDLINNPNAKDLTILSSHPEELIKRIGTAN